MKRHWKRHTRRPASERSVDHNASPLEPRTASGEGVARNRPISQSFGKGPSQTILEGVIQHHGGFAFLLAEAEGGSDVFLRGRGLDLAMDGDRVQAKVRRGQNGRFLGEIICVLKRARTSIVGILKHSPKGWAVFPEKGFAPPAQVIGFAPKIKPREGAIAVLAVTRWPAADAGAAGTITEVLGDPENVRVRISALLRSRDILEEFPKETLAQSAAFGARLESTQWRGREELFHLPIVTIDGADAKDFDDAVSLECVGGNLVRLGVHIADVAHYVGTGTALDKEAYSRGTSVYLPDRVVPMLPPALSNNLCSLVPNQPRLTLSIFMDVNSNGRVTRRRIARTVIRSCRRFTYDEVQLLLDGQEASAAPKAAAQAIHRMGALATVLNIVRVKRGALDFNLPEYKVETDPGGRPLRVVLRPRLQSHRLIEEFMLLANESVAAELMSANIPFLHRRHDAPDPAKLKTLAETLGDLGLSAGHITGGNTHKGLQDVLRQARGNPLEDIMNSLIVRAMRQAVYSPQSSGHFGIAARAYSHFTSPIRRYPDLMTHRAVIALLGGKAEKHGNLTLEKAGAHCSERERAAAEAEHKSVDLMRAELFKSQVGVVMDGTVTAVTESGAFVRLGDSGAEGLLRGSSIRPGSKVSVRVSAVDAAKGRIDLSQAGPNIPPAARWQVLRRKKRS